MKRLDSSCYTTETALHGGEKDFTGKLDKPGPVEIALEMNVVPLDDTQSGKT